MKLINIVGARPQFIKLAPILRAIDLYNKEADGDHIQEVMLHSGQHYDYEMSQVFFEELGLKAPDYHLGVGSGTHGYQTGEMLKRIEEVLLKEKPDVVMVYGDTNSTLAGALAAAKLHIPVAHVEAGLRSFNRTMPEEINRVLADHVADLLFCPTETAVRNLKRDGFNNIVNDGHLLPLDYVPLIPGDKSMTTHHVPLVLNVGDVMYDAVLQYAELADRRSRILEELGLEKGGYALTTVHRAENTEAPERLRAIFLGLEGVAGEGLPVILPLHPRTRKEMQKLGIASNTIRIVDPVSYLDMLLLEKNARVIITDSGGVQKEAFFFRVPCVTFREETEWVETVEAGWNVLVDCNPEIIIHAVLKVQPGKESVWMLGDGNAADRIIKLLLRV